MRANPTYLAECTWPEASTALDGAVILLPVVAIVAHGAHLPLNGDVVIASESGVLAEKVLPG
jgi:creatinine amidohydrolase/Fe(II)-dependent formamide hydrolase-like protein